MKRQIRTALLTLLSLAAVVSTTAQASEYTAWHVVERIQTTDAGVTYIRPAGLGTWGGVGCPNAIYAFIGSTYEGHDVIINLIMASKLNGTPIHFYGNCNAAGTYINITYAILQ